FHHPHSSHSLQNGTWKLQYPHHHHLLLLLTFLFKAGIDKTTVIQNRSARDIVSDTERDREDGGTTPNRPYPSGSNATGGSPGVVVTCQLGGEFLSPFSPS